MSLRLKLSFKIIKDFLIRVQSQPSSVILIFEKSGLCEKFLICLILKSI